MGHVSLISSREVWQGMPSLYSTSGQASDAMQWRAMPTELLYVYIHVVALSDTTSTTVFAVRLSLQI